MKADVSPRNAATCTITSSRTSAVCKKNNNVWGSVLSECFFCTVSAGERRCDKTTMCNTKAKNALKFCFVMSSHVVLTEASREKRNSLLSVGMTAAL